MSYKNQGRTSGGQFTGYSIEELYAIYKMERHASKIKLKERGDTPYVKEDLTGEQFATRIIQARNEGKKAGVKFVKHLVADMEYKVSRKSAQASAKAFREYAKDNPDFAEETGGKIQPWEFRRGIGTSEKAEAWFAVVSDTYWALRNSGMKGKAAMKKVSQLMYGSPE